MRIEPQHPVPDRLQTDPADAGCLRARAAVVDLRKCQQTTPLGSALRRPGQPAKPCRIIVPACCNPRSHGESPVRHIRFPLTSFAQDLNEPARPRLGIRRLLTSPCASASPGLITFVNSTPHSVTPP